MPSPNKPVRGDDILAWERAAGLDAADVQWILGVTPQAYYSLRKRRDPPMANPAKPGRPKPALAQAMVMRILSDDPSLIPVPKCPTPIELYRLCHEIDPDFSQRHLAVLLGRDGTAAYKWLRGSGSGTAKSTMRMEVRRLALIVQLKLESTPKAQRKRALTELFDQVVLEASLRGYDPKILRERFRFVPVSLGVTAKPRTRRRKSRPFVDPGNRG